jgi:PAS domain S-box-containing protein
VKKTGTKYSSAKQPAAKRSTSTTPNERLQRKQPGRKPTRRPQKKEPFRKKRKNENPASVRRSSEVHTKATPKHSKQTVRYFTELVPVETVHRHGPYGFLVRHAPYGIGIVQQGKIILANPMFARLLGYRSASDIEAKAMLQFVEEGSQRSYQLLEQRKLRGEAIPSKFEIRFRRVDGSKVDVQCSLQLGIYNGQPVVIVYVSDITDQKRLETRLVDSERLFRNVVNSMVDALVITDLQGKVLDVNEGFERMTGFQRREVFGVGIPYPWVPEEDLRSYIRWLERLRENNFLKDFDLTWCHKDGSQIAVSMSTTLLRNTAGEPALMVNIARDISERQQAQHELAQQFQRMQVLYELSRALTETWDLHEIAVKTFKQVKRVIPTDAFFMTLYDEGKQMVRPIFVVDRLNGQEQEREQPSAPIPLGEVPAVAKVIASHESVLEHRSGQAPPLFPVSAGTVRKASSSVMYVPMFSKDRIIGVLSAQAYEQNAYTADRLALLESIASVAAIAVEKVKLYQETIAKSQEIEARNKELDDFTYVVSHDLKEPLISVEGYAKILKDEYGTTLDETGQQFLRSILEACTHMKRLIEDLLQLSRIGKLSEMKHEIDLNKLIAEVIEELHFSIQERGAQVTVAKNLPKVLSVEPFVKVIFRNLISNALKFCDKAIPVVEIGARSAESPIFYVRDNGIGIPPEYHEKIFLIFQRLHKREEYEGTGAGLTIARKIIEVHGGRIWVESTPGMGSTFYFTLPSS